MVLKAEKLVMCFRGTPRSTTGASPLGLPASSAASGVTTGSVSASAPIRKRLWEKLRRRSSLIISVVATSETLGASAAAASTADSAIRKSFRSCAMRAASSSSVLVRDRDAAGSGWVLHSVFAVPQLVLAVVLLPAEGVTVRFVSCSVSQVTLPVRSSRCTTNLNCTGVPTGSAMASDVHEGKVSAVVVREGAKAGDQLPSAS
mmetsp:Transcript_126045/g.351215  ORF Transcript_126045/g.351215 Transcript_126045/m.351215 type:complete len:203 (+) Transcript_126045:2032-2640(+)